MSGDADVFISQRDINLLNEGNRAQKAQILKKIQSGIPSLSADTCSSLDDALPVILSLLSDPAERVREESFEVLLALSQKLNNVLKMAATLLPIVFTRFGGDEILEPSEEVRTLCLQLLSSLITKLGQETIGPFIPDLVKILSNCLGDPAPDVKKGAASTCLTLSLLCEKSYEFEQTCPLLFNPLIKGLTHQHSRVRIEMMKAMNGVLVKSNGKEIDKVMPHIIQRLFDQVPAVRRETVKLAGNWLLDLPDRYSYFNRLIPIILSGKSDEQPEIRNDADGYWHDAGLLYLQENEEEFHDQVSFPAPPPSHYPGDIESRPNLGCRVLIQRVVSKLIPGMTRDLKDWQEDTRRAASILLYWLVLHSEEHITQQLQGTLLAMVAASSDSEIAKVRERACDSAFVLAHFVKPQEWVSWCAGHIVTCTTNAQTAAVLRIITHACRGTEPVKLATVVPDLLTCLTASPICLCASQDVQTELAKISQSIVACTKLQITIDQTEEGKLPPPVRECLSKLSLLLTCVCALNNDAGDYKIVSDCFAKLENDSLVIKFATPIIEEYSADWPDMPARGYGMTSTYPNLYAITLPYTLDTLSGSLWLTDCPERSATQTALMKAGISLRPCMSKVLDILIGGLKQEDAKLAGRLLGVMVAILQSRFECLDGHHRTILADFLIPQLKWKAGRAAEALRLTNTATLHVFLQATPVVESIDPKHWLDVALADACIDGLVSACGEDLVETRLVAVRCLNLVFTKWKPYFVGRQDRLHEIYPKLLKRFDDANDDVRIAMATAFGAMVTCYVDDYEVDLYRAHTDFIYSTLLLHLDDSNADVREAVLTLMAQSCGPKMEPKLLSAKISEARHKHKHTKTLDRLAQQMQSLVVQDGEWCVVNQTE